jgi:hypothetical protein
MQLQLAGKGTALGLQDTWRAVVGGNLGHRALLVGVLPRVRSSLLCGQHNLHEGRGESMAGLEIAAFWT